MLIFIAFCYAFLIWLLYFKLELFPYNKKHKIITTTFGILLLFAILCIVLAVTPYSTNLVINAKVNPVAARVAGEVETIFVKPGEIVEKDQPLFKLSTRGFDIRVDQAKGALQAAKSAYVKAQRQREIALGLEKADPESISQLQLINTEETLNELKGNLEKAQNDLEEALHDLSKTTVYAPAKGFTPFISFDNETTTNAYTPLMSFVSLSELYPVATYSQNALSYVRPNDKVEFVLDIYPGKVFEAKVETIVWAAGEAQVYQGQTIPNVNSLETPNRFVVKIEMDKTDEEYPLHFGSKGEVVIYTSYWKPFHMIQKIHLRMKAWLKYLALP